MLWVCVLLTTFACLIIIHHIHLSILNTIQQRHHIQFSSIYTYDKRDERRKEEKKIWNEQNRIDDTSKTVTMKHNASESYSIQFNLSYYRKYNMTLHYIAWHDMIWYDVLSYDNNLIIEMMKNENNKILSLTLSGIKVQDPLKPPHTHYIHVLFHFNQSLTITGHHQYHHNHHHHHYYHDILQHIYLFL